MLNLIDKQRQYFYMNETKSLQFRINNLRKLKNMIKLNEALIMEALYKDLGKSNYESFVSEIGILYDEINHMIKHLPKWSKMKKVKTPLVNYNAKSYVVSEPYGVTLIISPWNYPFQLTMSPLIGAIAGGNTAIIKPSEYSEHTTNVIEKMIQDHFKEEYVAVIKGGIEETDQLLNESFDYIFFTGSIPVGKIVMEKAAKHLTPLTLELGGKSPCIICYDADIDLTAKRIVFGKLLNSGQTCVAPDYLFVHRSIKNDLIDKIIFYIEQFFEDPLLNKNYPNIISPKHFNRLTQLIKDKEVIYGGTYDEETLKISPTLLSDINLDDPLMTEEIFGPILPILEFQHLNEAIKIIQSKPKPLALYLFTNDSELEKDVLDNLSFGGGCINDTIMHLATPYLPFGGVGESGLGAYHGKASFNTFTHQKSIFKSGKLFDVSLRYPPYTEKKLKMIKKIFK